MQKEEVATAAASAESGHSLGLAASLEGRDYTLRPGMPRQRDEKGLLSSAERRD